MTEAVRLTIWFKVTTDTLFLRERVYIETQTKPKTFCNLNLLSGSDISPEEDVMVIQAKDTASVMKILHNLEQNTYGRYMTVDVSLYRVSHSLPNPAFL
jgi:hypothetical protein